MLKKIPKDDLPFSEKGQKYNAKKHKPKYPFLTAFGLGYGVESISPLLKRPQDW